METTKKFVCPKDKRRFATREALQQHERDSHAGNKVSKRRAKKTQNKAPVGVASSARQVKGGAKQVSSSEMSRASGSDILAVLDVSSATRSGKVLAMLQVNPLMFPKTRLEAVAQLWKRWAPIRLELGFQTTLPTTAGGQFVVGWTPDLKVNLPNDITSQMRMVNVMQPHKILHGWESVSIVPNAPVSQKWLYIEMGNEPDDSCYGTFVILMTGAPILSGGNFQVTISLKWDIKFDSPALGALESEDQIIQADEGYYPYFTTYSSHLPTGFTDRLTMQENSNGGYSSIVRFTQAEVGEIYVPLKSDSIQYYDDKSELKNVGALVRMKEVADPFMWCFVDVAHAAAYISNSAASYVLAYTKGGPWTAGNPNLKKGQSLDEPLITNFVHSIPKPSNLRFRDEYTSSLIRNMTVQMVKCLEGGL